MANERKSRTKTVDVPPRGARNRDPITKASGAHPVEVGVGSALGGAAAGLAAGALAGPVGAVVGAVVGGVAGGYGGKAVGEAIDPTIESRSAAGRRAGKTRTGRSKTGATAKASTARRRGKPVTARTAGDDRRKRGPADRARVNVNQPWEVDYWTGRWGVTAAQLRQAVKKAGPLTKDVRRELGK